MKVQFIDEYGLMIFENDNMLYCPEKEDNIIIGIEEYHVRNRSFYLEKDLIVIELNQSQSKLATVNEEGNRLKQLQHAIVEVNKRQDLQEKKSQTLGEQLVSVRTHLRTLKK